MIYTIKEFCHWAEACPDALVEEVEKIGRNVSGEEKLALRESYPALASVLVRAMEENPGLAGADLLLEYKLPSSSSWCDVVLLGENADGGLEVIVLELKNYLWNLYDAPGEYEGLMVHKGKSVRHPADQLKGYVEYCRRFHSAVRTYGARVSGYVYFTQPLDMEPYKASPNDVLTSEYELYNTVTADRLASRIARSLHAAREGFAARFADGFYEQDRNILRQVAANLQAVSSSAGPFVLLDCQREGFSRVMGTLSRRIKDGRKEVIIVEGPPGSGKSAIAANVWMEAVGRYSREEKCGNMVYVTTSSCQGDNWRAVFNTYGKEYHASDLILSANSFNPGMNGAKMKKVLLPRMRAISPKYVSETNAASLKFEYYEDYLAYMLEQGMTHNYKDNLHFLSVVDEAHALVNPTSEGFRSNKTAGWCFQMGPQAYHIIRESQVSIFFIDSQQSFRDNETTDVGTLEQLAGRLGAHLIRVSLEGAQFRCAGSVDYVQWVERLFTASPLKNAGLWKKHFKLTLADYPSEMEAELRGYLERGDASCRILSSYSRKWVSPSTLTPRHDRMSEYDFDLADKGGSRWRKFWNNPGGYDIFVQAKNGSKMHDDPLCEVGCPYVVRGFDYDHVGLLWLDDLFVRDGRWYLSLKHVEETANGSARARAREEQRQALRDGRVKGRMADVDVIPCDDDRFSAARALFAATVQAYRILLTRALKSLVIYIQDSETREYVRGLLEE